MAGRPPAAHNESGVRDSGARAVLRSVVFQASVLPLAVLVVLVGVLIAEIAFLQRLQEHVDHTDVVIGRTHLVERLVTERESALRGYLLTRDVSFLEAYHDAAQALGPALDDLRALVSDNPAQGERLRRLVAAERAWDDRAQAFAAGESVPGGLPGNEQAMALVRGIAEGFVAVEDGLRATRQQRAKRAAKAVVWTAGGLAILLGATLAFGARRQVRRAARVFSSALDRSERARAELEESEERFRLFAEGARGQGIYLLDAGGSVRSWNVGAERLFGFAPEEIVGQPFERLYTDQDRAAGVPARELADTAQTGHLAVEGWRQRRDGSRFLADVDVTALRAPDGTVRGYSKVLRDVTAERRAAERREVQYEVVRVLAETRTLDEALPELLRVLGEGLRWDAGLAWLPDGDVLGVAHAWAAAGSPAAAFVARRDGGFRRGEGRLGRAWDRVAVDWVNDLERAERYERTTEALAAGIHCAVIWPATGTGTGAGAVRAMLELFAREARAPDDDVVRLLTAIGRQVGGFVERTETENALRALERRRAEELELRVEERTRELAAVNHELEAFSYSVSHDLRAPLRSIEGFSQILGEDYADRLGEEGRSLFRRVQAATTRMGQLIDDMLLLSRVTRSELKREPVDVSGIAAEVASELSHRDPSRPVEVRVAPGLEVEADPRLVRIALENLLGNAWKFTRGREAAHIEVGAASANGGERAFFVRDDGAGFDMAYAGKLFQPFQRLHRATEYEGTGIGLATLQRIVQKHGGRVWAEGRPGRGATFYFTLEAAHG